MNTKSSPVNDFFIIAQFGVNPFHLSARFRAFQAFVSSNKIHSRVNGQEEKTNKKEHAFTMGALLFDIYIYALY